MAIRNLLLATMVAVVAVSPGAAPAQAPAASVASVPPLEPVARTLPNGARIYSLRDPASAVVSVHAFYLVGQRDDPRGRGGFAHLFEHLMFRTTRNLPDGVSAFITAIGGQTNASTVFDQTPYYIQAPANQLEALIWLEGERLRNLVIDEPSFAAERNVVKEEIRQRVLSAPYGRILYTLLPGYTFRDHPYARPIGGTLADLDAATLSDVRAFHEAYYRPDNVIFVVSGNFDQAQLDSWADRYIGSIPRPQAAIPRDDRREMAPLAARTVDAFAPNVPLPALIYSWRATAADDPDVAALGLVEALLVRGASGRLRRGLVDGGIASSVSSFNIPARDGHAFALVVTLAEGRQLADAQAGLDLELARLRDTPATEAELNAVKNALLGEALLRRETPRGRAFELGDALVLTGDPGLPDRRLREMLALTPQDVRAAARRLLDPAHRVAIRYQNESARTAAAVEPPPADVSAMGPVVPPASRPAIVAAAAGEREQPPAAGPDAPRAVPQLAERRLGNGMRVVVARSTDVPLVTMRMLVDGGDSADPTGKAGLGDLLAATLLRGAGERDANGMSAAIDSLGASIGASSDSDATSVTVTAPLANAEAAGRLLADVVRRPALPEAELARVRSQQVSALTVSRRQPMAAALRVLTTALFEGSRYGAIPNAETLGAVSRADVAAAHQLGWQPRNATLVVAGALTPDEGFALAERLFGSWQGGATAPSLPLSALPDARPQVVVVDMPGAAQAAVVAGLRGPPRNDPGFPALRVATARLGGGFVGFLNQEIRVRRGLSYGAGSQLDPRGDSMMLIAAAQTRNDAATEVVDLIRAQMRRVVEEPASAADAEERSTYVGNALAAQAERTEGLAAYLASLVATDTLLAVARAELAGTPALSPAAIQAAAAATFRTDALTIVVAGDSRHWIDALRRQFPDLRLVTFDGAPAQ